MIQAAEGATPRERSGKRTERKTANLESDALSASTEGALNAEALKSLRYQRQMGAALA